MPSGSTMLGPDRADSSEAGGKQDEHSATTATSASSYGPNPLQDLEVIISMESGGETNEEGQREEVHNFH